MVVSQRLKNQRGNGLTPIIVGFDSNNSSWLTAGGSVGGLGEGGEECLCIGATS
jgi:hypothetical protein